MMTDETIGPVLATLAILPWLKIGLLLSFAVAVHVATSSPQAVVSASARSKAVSGDDWARWICNVVKVVGWTYSIIDIFTSSLASVFLTASAAPTSPSSTTVLTMPMTFDAVCPRPTHTALVSLHDPSVTLILSITVVILGALLRKWCYVTLGQFFTFERTVLPKHELVTWGPYAWLRHPSYTGQYLVFIGIISAMLCQTSYVRECRILQLPFSSSSFDSQHHASSTATVLDISLCILFVLYCAMTAWALVGMFKRTIVEDEQMREKFRERWEEWRKVVKWRMIPWVY